MRWNGGGWRRTAGKRKAEAALGAIIFSKRGRHRSAVDAGGRRLQHAQRIEFRGSGIDLAGGLALGPEITEQIMREHRAEAVRDDDDALVIAAFVHRVEQFQPTLSHIPA